MKRVLILGTSGFVGTRLARALQASDWAEPIAGFRRSNTFAPEMQTIRLDATQVEQLEHALEVARPDVILNTVLNDPETITRNAEALFAVAGRHAIPVVFFSSMAVYGSATGLVPEDTPLQGDLGSYSVAKVAAESIAAKMKTPVTIFRPGCIYGSDSGPWTQRIAAFLRSGRVGNLGAAGEGFANLVHINDVVEAACTALRGNTDGVRAFNLCAPNPITWNGYFEQFAQALGETPQRRISQMRLKIETKLLAPPLYIAGKFTKALLQPITPSLAELWRQRIVLDPTLTTAELGVHWTSLEDGIAEATGRLA